MKFDIVAQWVNVLIPPVRFASASGKETNVQRESHPAKVQPTGSESDLTGKPGNGRLKLRKLKVEKQRPQKGV
ncbi:MAG: hypothetical protein GY749_45105 [Desulfobacteraceae bacterium]|nr:hypothetical protein [Desulfobacteraceae bacterium]